MTLRRHMDDEDAERERALYREAFELEDDEEIDPSDFEMWRRQQRGAPHDR